MRTFSLVDRRTKALGKIAVPSKTAQLRLKWLDFYRAHDQNAALTRLHRTYRDRRAVQQF